MIFRPDYIEAIKPFINQPLVKILAGIRRCGKSTIFEMLKEELLSRNVPESCIIMKRYTEMDIPENITAKQMYDELIAEIAGKENGGACAKIRKNAGLYHAGGIERDHRQRKAVGRRGSGNAVSGGICQRREEGGSC